MSAVPTALKILLKYFEVRHRRRRDDLDAEAASAERPFHGQSQ